LSERRGMAGQPRWRRYLRFWGPDVNADIDDELRYHVEMRTQDFIARGLSPDEATAAAKRLFGDEAAVARALRAHDLRQLKHTRRADVLQDISQDARYGLRQLRNAPQFTAAVVLVLALGIGANTAIFSTIDAAFLRPLPFAHPERLVSIQDVDVPFEGWTQYPRFHPHIDEAQADSATFAGVAAYASGGLNLTGALEPVRVGIAYVTRDFFRVLGRTPRVGRAFAAEEFTKGGPHAVIIAHGLWQRDFAGASDVVGRDIELNAVRYRVVGVMPNDFRFPAGTDVWIPLAVPLDFSIVEAFRNSVPTVVIGRLAPATTLGQADQSLNALRRRFTKRPEKDETPIGELVRPLQTVLVGDRRTALIVLMGSAGLLLLIACANVTNLLISRAATRERELAVRVVLGATRARVLRQLVIESLLLALAGAVAALVVARLSLSALVSTLPPALIGVAPPHVDGRVLTFTFVLATTVSLIFGVWPALGASRPNLVDATKLGGVGATRRRGTAARGALVVAELSLSLMLLVCAGLMIASLHTLLNTDSGIRSAHVVTGRLMLARARYRTPPQKAAFLDAIVRGVRARPGVQDAAAVSALPMERAGGIALRVAPADAPDDDARTVYGAYLMATPGYFKTIGARLRGADLPASVDTNHRVVVINETMAAKVWPGQNALGRQLTFGRFGLREVIGVVSNVRTRGLDEPVTEQMYLPMAEQPQPYAAIVARGRASTPALLADIRDAVRAVDAAEPVYALQSMDDVIDATVAPRRTNTVLLTIFGLTALLLAGVGVYAVLSYGVTQRTREIGVRVALGAQRGDVVRLVAGQGTVLAGAGITLGLVGAYASSRLLASILYGVNPHDVRVFAAAPATLAVIAVAAIVIPATRASQVDPLTALRQD
jgi:putative ABC transport system permease protein